MRVIKADREKALTLSLSLAYRERGPKRPRPNDAPRPLSLQPKGQQISGHGTIRFLSNANLVEPNFCKSQYGGQVL